MNHSLPLSSGIGRILAASLAVVLLAACGGSGTATVRPSSTPGASATPSVAPSKRPVGPPAATPLASPPTEPSGNGTTATIKTKLGDVVIELFTNSSPVAAENFINLAEAGFYDGVVFHRVVPGFMIQGGDPDGNGTGGPGYGIEDEPIVGEYDRGFVAMARTPQPNSQGSQFFICVADTGLPKSGRYAIFGRVTTGMEVVDQIVAVPNRGNEPGGGTAIDPVVMTSVTVKRP